MGARAAATWGLNGRGGEMGPVPVSFFTGMLDLALELESFIDVPDPCDRILA